MIRMDNEQQTHWTSNVHIGRGTLEQFKKEYDEINQNAGMFATASQLFMVEIPAPEDESINAIFEYIIYYKTHPNTSKQFNSEGKVEVNID